jgi:ATP-dependent Clp protease ATP-binding subunit ClpC
MYERFTNSARQAMAISLREARHTGQEDVGTEHILIGLVDQPDCSAAKILLVANVDPEALRLEVQKHTAGGLGPAGVATQPSQRAKIVLELAIEEAHSLGHGFIDTGHLLLGLIREQDGLAGRILRGAGLLPEVIREQVAEHLST